MKGLSIMDKASIESEANDLLSDNGIDASDGFDIITLARRIGFYVGEASLDDNEDGFVAVDTRVSSILNTGYNKVIGVNRMRDYYTKRFIIAHEIGHFVLHASAQDGDNIIYAHREKKSEKRPDLEQDVDYFAACLLMPREAFTNKYNMLSKGERAAADVIAALQRVFSAPFESVERRVKELALV